jgi:DNA-binding HxlR family transcriptional regulator
VKQARSYRLLCPIARGLDLVGDRWTLLVLRDLHAGPVRFNELHGGLPGLASNLLTDRLRRLESDGFILRREAEFGATVYELTDIGESTSGVLFELAKIGSLFPPPQSPIRPGNLRTLAVALKESLRGIVTASTNLRAGLLVDGEGFEITIVAGAVSVVYRMPQAVDVAFATSYDALMAVGDGAMSVQEFVSEHMMQLEGDVTQLNDLLDLLARAFHSFHLQTS